MRRMDRYRDEESTKVGRYNKNQELYHDISTNTKYTNITDVTNSNAYEIDNSNKNYTTRESYQRMKKYQNVENVPKVKKELADFNYIYKDTEKKVYDINSVLEEARKNRAEADSKEEKRRLKNTSYNILADLNREELEKYKKEKLERGVIRGEEDIRELIDTITSKTLAGEIDQATSVDLLSDLMATSIMDKVENPDELPDNEVELRESVEEDSSDKNDIAGVENIDEENSKKDEDLSDFIKEETIKLKLSNEDIEEISKKNEEEETKDTPKLTGADNDFYTRSMDLSDEDFMDDEFKEKKMPIVLKLFLILLVLALLGVAAYFIYQKLI